jgi:archaellum component FlaC
MTYIEVLEKMIERKQEEVRVVSNDITSLQDNFSKRKYIELGAEVKTLEICLDLAKVMFDEE